MSRIQDWVWRMLGVDQLLTRPDVDMDEDPEEAESSPSVYQGVPKDRKERYDLYDTMDDYDSPATVLDLYAEEATQVDYEKGKSVWFECPSAEITAAAEEVAAAVKLEESIFGIARSVAKWGDYWMRLYYASDRGVLGWKPTPPAEMQRVEDKYGRLVGFKQKAQKFRGKFKHPVSWPWDFIHYRNVSGGYGTSDQTPDMMYGSSFLRGMIRPWHMQVGSEDGAFLFRQRKATDRDLIMIGTGNMDPQSRAQWLQRWRQAFRRQTFIDPENGRMRHRFLPVTPIDDIFLPIRKDDGTRIDRVGGSGGVGEIYDLEYYVNKLAGAARVPKAYIGFEGDVNAKATLSQQDIRFARTIKRLQRVLIVGIRRLVNIHYSLKNPNVDADFWKDPRNQFLVHMTPVSFLDELERLDIIRTRNEIVEQLSRIPMELNLDQRVWAIYVLTKFAHLPEDMVLRLVAKSSTPQEAVDLFRDSLPLTEDARVEIRRMTENPDAPISKAIAEVRAQAHERWWAARVAEQTDWSQVPCQAIDEDYADDDEWQMLQDHMRGLLKEG